MTTIHLVFVIATGLAVLYSDEQALLWVTGRREALSVPRIQALHAGVSVGLGAIIATGGLLFIRAAPYYLSEPLFITKLAFVGALIGNGLFIERLSAAVTAHPFRALPRRTRLALLASGAISVTGWAGAALCGLLLS